MDKWNILKEFKTKGIGKKAIASKLEISKNTVKKYWNTEAPPKFNSNRKGKSYWLKYQKEIEESYYVKKLILSVIYENLKEKGATGKKSAFYEFCKYIKLNDISYSKLSMRYETLPGKQAQFDWAEYNVEFSDGTKRMVYLYSTILSNSRYRSYSAGLDKLQSTVIQSIEFALNQFEGTPEELLIDNGTQMVDNANRSTFKLNEKFEIFANFHNIKIVACKVRTPQTKGKVENPFKYLENHFIKNNEFKDFKDFREKLLKFNEKVNSRKHQEINKIPKEVYLEIEKQSLKSLNKISYFEHFEQEIRQVDHAGIFSFKNNEYSIPILYGKKTIRVESYFGYKIKVYSMNNQKIAEHEIPSEKHQLVINKKHYDFLSIKIKRNKYSETKNNFLLIFPNALEFIKKLQDEKCYSYRYESNKIIKLIEIYSVKDFKEAIKKCFVYNIFCYQFIFNYLRKNCDIKYNLINDIIISTHNINNCKFNDSINLERDLNIYKNIKGWFLWNVIKF